MFYVLVEIKLCLTSSFSKLQYLAYKLRQKFMDNDVRTDFEYSTRNFGHKNFEIYSNRNNLPSTKLRIPHCKLRIIFDDGM